MLNTEKNKNTEKEQLSNSQYLHINIGQSNKITGESQKTITLTSKRNHTGTSKLDLPPKPEILHSNWQITNKHSILHQIDAPSQIEEQNELVKIIQKCKEDAALKEQLAQNQFEMNKDFINTMQHIKPQKDSINSSNRLVLLPEHLKQKKELRDILVAKARNDANPQDQYAPIRARIVKKHNIF